MSSRLPTTRAEAIFHDARHFQTGRACGRGHLAPRFTANGNCVRCERERRRAPAHRDAKPRENAR